MCEHKMWRARRLELSLSQTELAKRVGVARSTVGRWETGEIEPDAAHRQTLLEALELADAPAEEPVAEDTSWMTETLTADTLLEEEEIPVPEPVKPVKADDEWLERTLSEMARAPESALTREPEPRKKPGFFSRLLGRKTGGFTW